MGSCETESSSDGKQSFAVFSSFSFDSRENLAVGELSQSKESNHQLPVETSSQGASVGVHFNPGQPQSSGLFESSSHQCERISEASSGRSNEQNHATWSQSQGEVQDKNHKEPHADVLNFKLATRPNSQKENSNTPHGFTVSSSRAEGMPRHNLEQISDSTVNECLRSSMNDTADEVSSVHTVIEEREKLVLHSPEGHCVRRQKKGQNQLEEPSKDIQTKKSPNMLSEILNFLDGANQTNSPLPINSETESNAGGFLARGGGCENINKVSVFLVLVLFVHIYRFFYL